MLLRLVPTRMSGFLGNPLPLLRRKGLKAALAADLSTLTSKLSHERRNLGFCWGRYGLVVLLRRKADQVVGKLVDIRFGLSLLNRLWHPIIMAY